MPPGPVNLAHFMLAERGLQCCLGQFRAIGITLNQCTVFNQRLAEPVVHVIRLGQPELGVIGVFTARITHQEFPERLDRRVVQGLLQQLEGVPVSGLDKHRVHSNRCCGDNAFSCFRRCLFLHRRFGNASPGRFRKRRFLHRSQRLPGRLRTGNGLKSVPINLLSRGAAGHRFLFDQFQGQRRFGLLPACHFRPLERRQGLQRRLTFTGQSSRCSGYRVFQALYAPVYVSVQVPLPLPQLLQFMGLFFHLPAQATDLDLQGLNLLHHFQQALVGKCVFDAFQAFGNCDLRIGSLLGAHYGNPCLYGDQQGKRQPGFATVSPHRLSAQ